MSALMASSSAMLSQQGALMFRTRSSSPQRSTSDFRVAALTLAMQPEKSRRRRSATCALPPRGHSRSRKRRASAAQRARSSSGSASMSVTSASAGSAEKTSSIGTAFAATWRSVQQRAGSVRGVAADESDGTLHAASRRVLSCTAHRRVARRWVARIRAAGHLCFAAAVATRSQLLASARCDHIHESASTLEWRRSSARPHSPQPSTRLPSATPAPKSVEASLGLAYCTAVSMPPKGAMFGEMRPRRAARRSSASSSSPGRPCTGLRELRYGSGSDGRGTGLRDPPRRPLEASPPLSTSGGAAQPPATPANATPAPHAARAASAAWSALSGTLQPGTAPLPLGRAVAQQPVRSSVVCCAR